MTRRESGDCWRVTALLIGAALWVILSACGRAPTPPGSSDQAASSVRSSPSPSALPVACSTRPGPRGGLAFAYMSNLQEAVLFGGQDSNNRYLSDTWAWKAGCWSQLAPLHGPPPLVSPAAAYDTVRNVVVMYGIYHGSSGWAAGTWIWNGADWAAVTTVVPLFPALPLAFDPNSQRVILFGESLVGGFPQTWAFDGNQWQQLSPSSQPTHRQQASMTLDPSTNSLLLFGGISGDNNQELADTWSWNGTNWTKLNPATSPPPRANATLVTSSSLGRVLLIGGEHAPSVLADAWIWDGKTWSPMSSIGPREGARAIDSGSQILVFGGWTDKQVTNDAWTWNGTAWATS